MVEPVLYTVGELGRLCGLSRSALLYYDSVGLLSPSRRSAAGYRLYTDEDRHKLERIVAYRRLGIGLDRIRRFLDAARGGPAAMLLRRVFEINGQIEELRRQQRLLLGLVEEEGSLQGVKGRLHELASLGSDAGIEPGGYREIHASFERNAPDSHRRLLAFLGFSETDISIFLSALDATD